MRQLFLFLILVTVLSSCDKDVKSTIEDYIAENNLQAESTADGLYYVIDDPGSEEKPDLTKNVTIHYSGELTNGNIFDSSYARGEPSEFFLGGNLIKGWKIGIPLFGKGGKGKLIVPPSLGYGSRSQPGIPANSVLVFDIELIDFE
jgi:FKBP-type peptidyl-prolyl cis-trans isomerase FkpA